MEFKVLGPLEITTEGRTSGIAAAKERALLAILLAAPNRVVSADRLIEELWEGSPPESATTSLRVLVSRLRKTLAEFDDRELIVTKAPGYVISIEPGELDATRFEALAARGRAQLEAGDPEGASRILQDALALWQGPAFADSGDLEPTRLAAARLEDARLGVLEDRVEADLRVGRHGQLVSELEALTAEHPVRERLWGQRMLALYRSGRQADALGVYQDLRKALDVELGIDPSPDLVELETLIIRQDPSLALSAESARTAVERPTGVVTLLLTDIEGSTPLWDAKPAAMAEAVARHDQLMAAVVASHGGSLLRSRGEGDSTFSVFARATDAAEAALEAHEALAAEQWPSGIVLRVRMALATGETIERDGDYYGTTVNRAARLRGVAQPGQIVVARSTADVIIDHLEGAELVELGEQALRGLRRPEDLFELRPIGNSSSPSEVPAEIALPAPLVRTATGVFVGREPDLDRLTAIFEDAAAGQRKLVLLAGEPGIGKTRLAAEFARRLHDSGGIVLFGRCDEDGGEPNQPFAEAIRELVRLSPALASPGGAHLARLVPDIAATVGVQAAPSLGDAESERRALFDAVARTIGGLSARSPVLVVVDDLHWATKPTLLMLRHLLRSEETSRLVVLATYRDTDVDRSHPLADVLADLRRETDMTRIAVGGLDAQGIADYVEATAGQSLDERDRRLADIVYEHTDGNPFFVVEVLRHFVETGAVYRADGRWYTDMEAIESSGLPEGVRDVITRRIGRLSETVNKTLAVASVIGPEFSLEVLERVVDDASPDELLDSLERSVRAGVINESAPGRYGFVHALVRQTLYGELMSTRRARLHRHVGEAIEALPGPEARVEQLAHHFAEAALDGQVVKAARYAVDAGRTAIERLAYEEAATHIDRGLAVLDLDRGNDDVRADLLYYLAIARWSRGDRDGAADATGKAADAARAAADVERLARIAILRAALAVIFIPDAVTESLFDEAINLLPETQSAARARLLASYARYQSFSKMQSADIEADEAVRLARVADDVRVLGSALNARLLVLQGLGRPTDQRAIADELAHIAETVDDHRTRADALIARAMANLELAEIEAVRTDLAALGELGRESRWWMPTAFAKQLGGCLASMQGRFNDAVEVERQLGRLGAGDAEVQIMIAASAMVRCVLQGNGTQLRAWTDPATKAVPYLRPFAVISTLLEEAFDGEFEHTATLLLGLWRDLRVKFPLGALKVSVVSLMIETMALARWSDLADELLMELANQEGRLVPAARGGTVIGSFDHFRGLLLALLERYEEAEAHFERALDLEQRIGAAAFAARTRYWYAQMLIERGDADDRERAVAMLRQAKAFADETGMRVISREATALLGSMSRVG